MEQKEEVKKNGPLNLDFEQLLPRHDDDGDEEPPLLVVATTIVEDDDDVEQKQREELRKMSDRELEEGIFNSNRTLKQLGGNLADGGLKIRAKIKRYQDEIDRRRLQQLSKEDHGCEKLKELKGPQFTSASDGVRPEASVPASQSLFSAHFSKKLDGKNTDSRTVNAFESEFSVLRRCDRGKRQYTGRLSPKGQPSTTLLSSRQSPFQCPTNLSVDGDKPVHLKKHQNGGHFSVGSPFTLEGKVSRLVPKKSKLSQVMSSNNLRPRDGKTVVLLDEEEAELSESVELTDEPDECMQASKIYYPSSDDPESIEICGSDMECLKPQAYLSSTVMNFYIQYLLQNPPTRERRDYHFFNTYFYNKLKEAVLKKNDQEYFIKFRRWWKGVDIFHKAYVLLPIHETVHWSLVIICIPDKEDESGPMSPILLHLDSLGLHSSRLIFDNIKSFLGQEWEYLNREEASSDLSIADRIRKKLRIEGKTISVPQQKNDYDCGLFVLYFMERFIGSAPQRLKKKDLAMFTNNWFKPEEASSMRTKVRNILRDEFRKAITTGQNCVLDQDPLSSVGLQEQKFGQTIDC